MLVTRVGIHIKPPLSNFIFQRRGIGLINYYHALFNKKRTRITKHEYYVWYIIPLVPEGNGNRTGVQVHAISREFETLGMSVKKTYVSYVT